MTRRLALLAVPMLLAAVLAGGLASAGPLAAIVPVDPTPFTGASLDTATWQVLEEDAEPVGTADWRIVEGTGNCCENFVMADPEGRLFNWGGTHIIFSDDDGLTWSEVRPPAASPADNGEGAIAMAPDGDVLGVTWDPYQGDRLQSFLFDSARGAWSYAEQPLHLPFYDRPWFTTVPGADVGLGGDYLSVARGAWPSKDVLQYSGDGLVYPLAGSKRAESMVNDPIGGSLPVEAYPAADWIQPHAETTVVPLGGGYAFGGQEFMSGGLTAGGLPCPSPRYLMTPDGSWHCYTGGEDVQWQVADSTGALHAATWSPAGTLTYERSTDGGATVERIPLTAPAGIEFGPDVDIRASGVLGTVVIAASGRTAENVGQHMVIVISEDPETGEWVHDRTMLVGDGDLDYGSGVGAGIRFDFASIALLPDGRVAVSFNDAARTTPAVAIELRAGEQAGSGDAAANPAPSALPGPVNFGR